MSLADITLSFDIGHASIGWSVFQIADTFPRPLGAGVVLFPADSCLASSRRGFRRSRRNIAARRSRVARVKKFLIGLGVLDKEALDENSVSWPWLLAARVLASDGAETLSWRELWSVLRWYAHNRGYDGNALWAGDAIDAEELGGDEDSQKVEAARELMARYGKNTMAETFCAFLGLDPFGEKRASRIYFKGNNAAFPRETVENEIRRILKSHVGRLPGVDDALIEILLKTVPEEIRVSQKLPARFSSRGGLLLGQYVPRFDNRIIGKCRMTGKNVPLKNCKEYLFYRWGCLLNKLKVFDVSGGTRTLSAEERKALDAEMRSKGFLDKKSLNLLLKQITCCQPANTESFFLIPEMEDALILDPVKKLIASRKNYLKDLWPCFSRRGKKIFASRLARGEVLTIKECVEQMDAWGEWSERPDFVSALKALELEENKKKPEKRRNLLKLRIAAEFPSGRASYCKEILKKTYEEALNATDSTRQGGCLYETEEIRERLLRGSRSEAESSGSEERWIASQTNNHMVRHRLLIFSRLLRDIVDEYAGGDACRVGDVVVEVVKELKEFSGMSAQEIHDKLDEKFANFNAVSRKLKAAAEEKGVPVTSSLIRKARLLEDQNFTCPYTGQPISYNELLNGVLEKEHIIPRSLRPSDALSSCVMTFRAVNEMKEQRTAMQFMKEFAGKDVPGTNFQIQPLKDFEAWTEAHKKQKLRKGFFSKEDRIRCERRAELLLLEKYEERNADFTERDLTQTSHLNKLAIRLVKRELGINARHLAGAITGFVRKNLCIDECLVAAVPRMQRAARVGGHDPRKLLKSEMRDLSHLHHAMDAVTQGLTGILFRTEDWTLLVKPRLSERERRQLSTKYPDLLQFSSEGEIGMKALPVSLLKAVEERLSECRVVRHVPAKMHGMSVEQTTWSIVSQSAENGKVALAQHTKKQGRYDASGKRFVKYASVKPSMLLGLEVPEGKSGKLKSINGVVKISENWGCSLDPEPTVIPHFKVFPRLRELKRLNAGKPLRILRRGQLIEVLAGKFKGVWMVVSIKDEKNGVKLDVLAPDRVQLESGVQDSKRGVAIKSLIQAGLRILKPSLTGIKCPTI